MRAVSFFFCVFFCVVVASCAAGRDGEFDDDLDDHAVDGAACFTDVDAFAVYAGGVVVGRVDGDGHLRLQRLRGRGCAVDAVGGVVVADALYDVDDDGNVYVAPAGVVFDRVDRVGVDGSVAVVAEAGRGIWSFNVSPSGRTAAITACGPTGVFAVDDDGGLGAQLASGGEGLLVGDVVYFDDDDAFAFACGSAVCTGDGHGGFVVDAGDDDEGVYVGDGAGNVAFSGG